MCVYNNIYVHIHTYICVCLYTQIYKIYIYIYIYIYIDIHTYITNVPASQNNKSICFSSQKTVFHGLMILPNIRKEMEVS